MEIRIEAFLDSVATLEYKDQISRIFDMFELAEISNYEDSYLMLISRTEKDPTQLLQEFDLITHDLIDAQLLDHGIKVLPEAPILVKLTLYQAIWMVQSYDDPEEVFRILDDCDNSEEALAELAKMVLNADREDLLLYIEGVNPKLMTDLRELLNERKTTTVSDNNNREIYAENLTKFIRLIGHQNLLLMDVLIQGLDVGFDAQVYLDILGSKIDALSDEKVAQEMIAIALVSRDNSGKSLEFVRGRTGEYVHDVNRYPKIDKEVVSLLSRLEL